MTAQIINLRDRMQAQPCHCDRGGSPFLCDVHNKIRSLDEYRRQQKVQLPCDVEPIKDFAE